MGKEPKTADSGGERRGWRGAKRAAPGSASRHDWEGKSDPRREAAAGKNLRRRVVLGLTTGLALSLLGIFLYWVTRQPLPTPLVAVAITTYAAPLLPNAFAFEDINRLRKIDDASDPNFRVIPAANEWDSSTWQRNFRQLIKDPAPGGPGKNVVLVYLSAHGVVNQKGESCLILADSRTGEAPLHLDETQWIRVKDVVAELKNRYSRANCVLLLDCNRMAANWGIGLLYNAFAEGLASAVTDAPNVFIINSTGPGQVACTGSQLGPGGASAFGYYLNRCLCGTDADTNKSNGISLKELHAALKNQVAQWSLQNCYEIQEPMLVAAKGADLSFEVVDVGAPSASDPATSGDPSSEASQVADDTAEKLDTLWTIHARYCPWSEDYLENKDPQAAAIARERLVAWTQFGAGLVRAEQLLQAGAHYHSEAITALNDLKTVADSLASSGSRASTAAYSLPLARPRLPAEAALNEQRKKLQTALASGTAAAAGQAVDYLSRADAAWQYALREKTREAVQEAIAFAGQPEQAFGPEVVEMQWLRMLAGTGNLPSTAWEKMQSEVANSIVTRHQAEGAAVAADERVHYAIHGLVKKAEADREIADDALFVGNPNPEKRQSADRQYQEAIARSNEVAKAFAARDRAFAELPYLAQWLTPRPDPDTEDSGESLDDRELQTTAQLAAGAHDLAGQLDALIEESLREEDSDSKRIDKLGKTANDVLTGLRRLHSKFDLRVRDVQSQTKDNRTMRDIAALLATPLVTGADRTHLRSIYDSGLGASDNPTTGRESVAQQKNDEQQRANQRRCLAILATAHPVLALLGIADVQAPPKPADGAAPELVEATAIRFLAKSGQQVREDLAGAEKEIREQLAAKRSLATTPDIAEARDHLSKAEMRARSAVPVAGGAEMFSLSEASDPVCRLLQFDLGQLLLFQVDRTLADFYGPSNPDGSGEPPPYFAAVCDRYRDDAGKLCAVDDGILLKSQLDLFLARKQAAREFVTLATDGDQSQSSAAGFDRSANLKFAPDLPAGDAALYLIDDHLRPTRISSSTESNRPEFVERLAENTVGGNRPGGAGTAASGDIQLRVEPMPVTANGAAISVTPAVAAGNSSGDPAWQIVAFFRGHRRDKPFGVAAPETPIELVSKPGLPPSARVTVLGEITARATIVFVLDCSASMAGEKPNYDYVKWNAALGALNQILPQLAAVGKYDVGLWLYGHRVGVAPVANGREWNDAWGADDPAITTKNDVDQVMAVTPLDAQSLAQDFLPLLNDEKRVRPRGQTPLYLAIQRAVSEDLARRPANAPRRLIVITDGEGDDPERANAVVGALAGTNIQLDIIGVETNPNGRMQQLAANIAQGRGSYLAVQGELSQIVRRLKTGLGPLQYRVEWQPAGSAIAEHRDKPLTQPLTINPLPAERQLFVASLLSTQAKSRFTLQGGESLELYAEGRDPQWSLAYRRYDREVDDECERIRNPALGGTERDLVPTAFYIAAHTPTPAGKDAVKFRISIQNQAPKFSPRPAEAWVEITPLVGDEPSQGKFHYPIYDMSFALNQPVPILECVAPAWPAEADGAQIEVWFKLTKTSPTYKRTIRDLAGDDDRTNPAIEQVGGASFAVQMQRPENGPGAMITVSERYGSGSKEPWQAKVELLDPPDEIRRKFYPNARRAEHQFIFRNRDEASLMTNHLWLTPRSALADESDAVRLPRPLKVKIPRQALRPS